jgi:hypothetical protein
MDLSLTPLTLAEAHNQKKAGRENSRAVEAVPCLNLGWILNPLWTLGLHEPTHSIVCASLGWVFCERCRLKRLSDLTKKAFSFKLQGQD